MAEAGIGVDIVEIARIEQAVQRTPRFVKRVFSQEERDYCDAQTRPAVHYAARFAAREAILKALGTGFGSGISLSDIAVSRDQRGKPLAVLSGKAREIANQQGVQEVALSLSHTNDLAVANALAITGDVRPQQKKDSPDERAQIARSFKEARSVLDELDALTLDSLDTVDVSSQEADS